MATISVIVPVYKVEAYLGRCVNSILSQRFSDFELILVDDGSPDNCGALCEEYARQDGRIRVLHRQNGGLSAARNTGIDWAMENSKSAWFAFVDSDDWVHLEYLQTLYEAVTTTDCLISACGCQRTAGEDLEQAQDLSVRVLTADDYYCGNFHDQATPVAWNKLYSRSLFETLRYPEGKLHEDEFTTFRAVYQAGRVAATEAKLYAYFQNTEGITLSAWNPRRLDGLEGMRQQIAFARQTGNQRLYQKISLGYILSAYEQLHQAEEAWQGRVRKLLRWGLRQGRISGSFPLMWFNVWAYEEAYPYKTLWWLVSKFRPTDEELLHGR